VVEVSEADAPKAVAAGAGAERLRLEADLLAAQEELREVRAERQRAEDELARAREDLSAERERHAADAERFREGLARVRGSAEDALAVEQSAALRLGSELRDAQEAIDELQVQLDTAAGATAETDALRSRVAELESAAEEARTDAERLLGRLTTIRGGGR